MEIKAANAVLDWPISWVLADEETISGSTWSAAPAETGGLAVVAGSPAVTGEVTSCLVSGGVFRRVYTLTNRIITSQGRALEQTITIRIGPSEVTG
jgi:hypothetical protein